MSFTMVTLVGNIDTGAVAALPGAVVSATLSTAINDGVTWLDPIKISATVASDGSFSLGPLPANTDISTLPQNTSYSVTIVNGVQTIASFSIIVPTGSPTIDLFSLAQLENAPPAVNPFVETFNGRSGPVTLLERDIVATGFTGADAGSLLAGNNLSDVGSPSTALTNLGGTTPAAVATAVATETTRAGTAEALKAPLASPALTGTPTAPTQTTGDATTKIATDAFVATAVGVETTRAETAEALLAPIASPTFTGTTTAPEFTASGLTGATAATRYVGRHDGGHPTTGTFAVGDFVIDATTPAIWICETAGSPGTWGGGGGGSGLPLTGGTMSGAIAMGANKITGLANGSAATDAAAYGQLALSLSSILR